MLYAAQVNSKALQRVTQYIPAAVPKERMAQQAEIALASVFCPRTCSGDM